MKYDPTAALCTLPAMKHHLTLLVASAVVACGGGTTQQRTDENLMTDPDTSTATAPVPFPADELQAGVRLGESWTYSHEAEGESWLAHTEVIGHTAEGPTFAFWEENADGTTRSERTEAPATWPELVSHATYPLAETTITDAEETVPAGTFSGWLYRVERPDGAVVEAFFAAELAGPPVRWERILDGVTEHRMVLIERRQP